jgi:hypothetical protein
MVVPLESADPQHLLLPEPGCAHLEEGLLRMQALELEGGAGALTLLALPQDALE